MPLVGAATERTKFRDIDLYDRRAARPVRSALPTRHFQTRVLPGAIGGGLDIRINHNFQIRAIQIDYNPVRIGGFTNNNARIGAGIVFCKQNASLCAL